MNLEPLPIDRCLKPTEWIALAFPAFALGPLGLAWSLGAGVSLALAGAWLVRRRRRDRAYVARQLELAPEVLEIQELQEQALDDLRSCRRGADAAVLESLPRKLEELAIRSLDFGAALRKLESLPAEKEIAREVRSVDRRIQKCRSESQKGHWLQARSHLVRELSTIQRAREQRRQLECRLFALARFFRATRTEIRSLAARTAAQAGEADPALTGEVNDIIAAVNELETSLEEVVEAPVLPPVAEQPTLEPVHGLEPRLYRPR